MNPSSISVSGAPTLPFVNLSKFSAMIMVTLYRSFSDWAAAKGALSRMTGIFAVAVSAGISSCGLAGSRHAVSAIVVNSSFFISSKCA